MRQALLGASLDQLLRKSQASLRRPRPQGNNHPLGELCNLAYGQCSSPTDIVTLWEQCGPAIIIIIVRITAPESECSQCARRLAKHCQGHLLTLSSQNPMREVTIVIPIYRLRK